MFKKEKTKKRSEKRFEIVDDQPFGLGFLRIVVDTQTGVHYVVTGDSSPNHITPLLDHNGNVVIQPVE